MGAISYQFVENFESVGFGGFDDIDGLIKQLNSRAQKVSLEYMKAVASKSRFLVAWDGARIVGMGTLVLSLTPTDFRAHLEDMVVDRQYRGRGIGRKISEILIAEGKRLGVGTFNLASNPSRVNAIILYETLGFRKIDTNLFMLRE